MKNLFISCLAISAFIYSCTGTVCEEPQPVNDTITVIAVDSMHGDTSKVDTTKH
jgi:hypothetical protein